MRFCNLVQMEKKKIDCWIKTSLGRNLISTQAEGKRNYFSALIENQFCKKISHF